MTSYILPDLQDLQNNYTLTTHEQECLPYCTLTWRRGKLLVRRIGQQKQPYLPATDNKESLVECLKHSLVKLVLIDPELGSSKIQFWADAVLAARKSIYLSIPSINTSKQNAFEWLQVIINSIIALILLFALTPVTLGLIILMYANSSEAIFTREWYVGKRGKLFQVIKFRTNFVDDISIGYWMRKYNLDTIPLLLNVLRGEMSLIGRRNWKLEDAVKFDTEKLKQLHKAPGIASLCQAQIKPKLLHLDSQIL
ncbi:MAG: sugar transferase [Calothrix sp. C42_A2020_038]|nr:sugar transferase [Calothrix sp. C42_A2020_038]